MIRTDHIASLADAARRLDVPKRNLERWAERRAQTGFPHPIYRDRLGKGYVVVYDYLQIWAWYRDWKLQHRVNGTRISS